MSMRDLLSGYAVTLALFVIACMIIEQSAIGLKGIRWLKMAFAVACAGLALAVSSSWLPPFISIRLDYQIRPLKS